jgi:hypothetical protein
LSCALGQKKLRWYGRGLALPLVAGVVDKHRQFRFLAKFPREFVEYRYDSRVEGLVVVQRWVVDGEQGNVV